MQSLLAAHNLSPASILDHSPPLLIGSREVTKGAWVRLTFGVRSCRTEYIGMVTEIGMDTRELQVKFLRNRGEL